MAQRMHLETIIAFFGVHTGWSRRDIETMTLSQAIVQLYAVGKQQRNIS
jgi:hypothetical protein